MNFRWMVLGIVPKEMPQKTPVAVAIEFGRLFDRQVMVMGGFAAAILIIGGGAALFHFVSVTELLPVAGLAISVLAIIAVRASIMLPLLQIIQVANNDSENVALRKAIEELTVEMRRRPEPLSAPVNLALFQFDEARVSLIILNGPFTL